MTYIKNNYYIIIIILLFLLILSLIISIGLVIYIFLNNDPRIYNSDSGVYTITLNKDSIPLNLCGNNNNEPCLFTLNSIEECINRCNNLNHICEAFTYNQINQIMKIVDKNRLVNRLNTNLFIKH